MPLRSSEPGRWLAIAAVHGALLSRTQLCSAALSPSSSSVAASGSPAFIGMRRGGRRIGGIVSRNLQSLQPEFHTALLRESSARPDCTALFQNMQFSGASGDEQPAPAVPTEEEDDPLRWEKMYYSGASAQRSPSLDQMMAPQSAAASAAGGASSGMDPSATKSEIRVVTFDLDNTLWKTGETIMDANDALSAHLMENFGIAERSEKAMGRLFKQYPDRYAGSDFAENAESNVDVSAGTVNGNDYSNVVQNVGQTEVIPPASSDGDKDAGVHIEAKVDDKQGGEVKKKPVYLTLLRKDAIRSLLLEASDRSIAPVDIEDKVDAAFEVWVDARCNSISRNFAPSAVETMTNLRSQMDTSSRRLYVGAITDGNSDPNRVPELSGLFDFVIRAEDVGASKPDKRVYRAAVAALMARLEQDGRSVEEFFLGESMEEGVATGSYLRSDASIGEVGPSWKDVEDGAADAFADAVGPWWVHVGDDFFKDVVAAKEFRMRTVWTRELIGGAAAFANPEGVVTERTVADLMRDVAKSKDGVLTMSIGASDFLGDSLHEEFSDAILDRFGDLGTLLSWWHEEGGGGRATGGMDPFADDLLDRGLDVGGAAVGARDVGVSAPPATMDGMEYQQPAEASTESAEELPAHKFCVFCGGKLPAVAKFCSHCGEKQI